LVLPFFINQCCSNARECGGTKNLGARFLVEPFSEDFTMAIFKFILVAALPFVAAPFMTDQSSTTAARSGNVWSSTVASASEMQASKSHGESTIYKNQAIPGFLFKQFVLQGDELIFTPDYNAVVVQNRGYLEV
jgi:hypothetical protein